MSFRLTCDHCKRAIEESAFKGLRELNVVANTGQFSGFTTSGGAEKHYHQDCFDAREAAANDGVAPGLENNTESNVYKVDEKGNIEYPKDHPAK